MAAPSVQPEFVAEDNLKRAALVLVGAMNARPGDSNDAAQVASWVDRAAVLIAHEVKLRTGQPGPGDESPGIVWVLPAKGSLDLRTAISVREHSRAFAVARVWPNGQLTDEAVEFSTFG